MSRVETEKWCHCRERQSGVCIVRDLLQKGFIKEVSLSLEGKSEGVMDGESGEEKDGLR